MLENYVMPKVLVLFDSADQRAERLAELTAEGAKRVRFTEVDIRAVGAEASAVGAKRKRLESNEVVDQYDGVVFVGSDREPAAAIEALLAAHSPSNLGEFVNRVFAAVSQTNTSQQLAVLGGIIVGTPSGLHDLETNAGKTGERVAKVAEWVRHALSHEHGHVQSHHTHSGSHHSH